MFPKFRQGQLGQNRPSLRNHPEGSEMGLPIRWSGSKEWPAPSPPWGKGKKEKKDQDGE